MIFLFLYDHVREFLGYISIALPLLLAAFRTLILLLHLTLLLHLLCDYWGWGLLVCLLAGVSSFFLATPRDRRFDTWYVGLTFEKFF